MMGEIYSKAAQTVVWIGEEQGDAELAFELLNQLAEAGRELCPLSQLLNLDQDVGPVFPRIAKFLDEKYWTALENLTSRPYWKRLWVVQEAVLGNFTEFRCGRLSLLLDNYRLAIYFTSLLSSPCNARFLTTLQRIHINGGQRDHFLELSSMKAFENWISFDYPSLLHQLSSQLDCKDPRDKIFALIALAELSPVDRRVRIIPDYNKPVSLVFRNFATTWLRSTEDFTLIAYAGTDEFIDDVDLLTIPSWVPKPGTMSMMNFPYKLPQYNTGSHTSSLNYFVTGNKLHLDAVLFDTVSAFETPEFNRNFGLVADGLKSLFDLLDFDYWLHRTLPTGLPWLQILFRTIISDTSGSGDSGWPDLFSASDEDTFFEQAAGFCGLLEEIFEFKDVALEVSGEVEDFALTVGRWAKRFGLYPLRLGVQTRDTLLEPFCGPVDSAKYLQWPRMQKDMGNQLADQSYIDTQNRVANASFFMTARGYIGLVAKGAVRNGDTLCIVPGCKVPLVVRKVGSGYKVQGDCYVFGVMKGEVMQQVRDGKVRTERIYFT